MTADTGAQAPKSAGGEPWESDPGIRMVCTCGACPLQFEGTIDGVPAYFRARGDEWRLGIGGDGPDAPVLDPAWEIEGQTEGDFSASWMDEDEGRRLIQDGAVRWRAARAALAQSPAEGSGR